MGASLTTQRLLGASSVAKIFFFIRNEGFSKCGISTASGKESESLRTVSSETIR